VELSRQLQAQLVGLREEHQAILQRLKEAHGLIERHLETNAQLSASEVGHFSSRHTRVFYPECFSTSGAHNNNGFMSNSSPLYL